MSTTTQIVLAVHSAVLADASTISLNPLVELVCRIGLSVMGLVLLFRVIIAFAKGDVGSIISSVALFGVCVWFVIDPSGATGTIVSLTKQVAGAVA